MLQPDDSTASSWKDRPKAIREVQRRLLQVKKGERWLSICDQAPVYYRGGAYERRRSMRPERVEAVIGLLDRYAEYVSLASRVVFHNPKDGIVGLRLATIAEQLGFGDRRIDRAQRDVAGVGYIESAERCDYDPELGRYRGIAAVRQFTPKLIAELGLTEIWAKWAKHAYKKAKARLAQAARKPSPSPVAKPLPPRRGLTRARAVNISQALPSAFRPPG